MADEKKDEQAPKGKKDTTRYTNEEGLSLDPDYGQERLQKASDKVHEQGYIGVTPDPTPNENYSLQTDQHAPTPETDADLFDEARDAAIGHPLKDIDKASVSRAEESKSKKKKE